jgi:hypothetical protein
MIPTAEEFFDKNDIPVSKAMIEFAKLHVEVVLNEAKINSDKFDTGEKYISIEELEKIFENLIIK